MRTGKIKTGKQMQPAGQKAVETLNKLLLQVKNLNVSFPMADQTVQAVRGVDFEIYRGEVLALVGESGCGKSATLLSLVNLLPPPGIIEPQSRIRFEDTEMVEANEETLQKIRGDRIAMIFQEPSASFNPLLRVGRQVGETLVIHHHAEREASVKRAQELLDAVQIPEAEQRSEDYPFQLSGGMLQRAMIAQALSGEPDILLADEPTTSLDVTTQAQILGLIRDINTSRNMAVLFVTHDLALVSGFADRVLIMYAGRVIESTRADQVFGSPLHPYTRDLYDALPVSGVFKDDRRLYTIQGTVPDGSNLPSGCPYAPRCRFAFERCTKEEPPLFNVEGTLVRCWLYSDRTDKGDNNATFFSDTENHPEQTNSLTLSSPEYEEPILIAENLVKHYPIKAGGFSAAGEVVHAVNSVSFTIHREKTLGLVGESGSGKTTTGRMLLRIIEPTSGRLYYAAEPGESSRLPGRPADLDFFRLEKTEMKQRRLSMQYIFQDPFHSLDPKMQIRRIITEPLLENKLIKKKEIDREASRLLDIVGLPNNALSKYPHEFSGGQRQRISIARALSVNPRFIVCDEPVSSLDVSIQSQILNLLLDLQKEFHISYLFIAHNLAVVFYMSDTVAVMYAGSIVEYGPSRTVSSNPLHPYTRLLISAVPEAGKGSEFLDQNISGEVPSLIRLPKGCPFAGRCPLRMDQCRTSAPPLQEHETGHFASCYALMS
ncbi:MAG: ABC transporter ATP-binding protein [Spirochaetales bacterium]|nr:ABC transporter ATP-binding protein [Spirochaetales bacterium]MCF7938433.1 ABC transporter ATP-binding protein [Spirochaetales bacterium]